MMKVFFYITTFIAIAIISMSCEKSDCTTVVTSQAFFLVDKKGNDLLNHKNSNISIDPDKLSIYYLKNGKLEEQKGVHGIYEYGDGRYYMNIGLNETPSESDISYTYIRWNHDDMDTIASKVYNGSKGGCDIRTAYMQVYNDSTWSSTSSDYIFTIIADTDR